MGAAANRKGRRRSWRSLLLAVACLPILFCSFPALGLEISIEENRAGVVGFVDIRRVFDEFPETLKARDAFEDEVRRRDAVLRKQRAKVRELRQRLTRLKTERALLEEMPLAISSATAPSLLPAESAPLRQDLAPSTTGAAGAEPMRDAPAALPSSLESLPGMASTSTASQVAAPAKPTPAAKPEPLPVAKPKPAPVAKPEPIPVAKPEPAPIAEPEPAPIAEPKPATAAGPEPIEPASEAAAAGEGETPLKTPPAPSLEDVQARRRARLAELDLEIAQAERSLKKETRGLRRLARKLEGELTGLEKEQSRALLGKIYRQVQALARKERVSIVLDKAEILYGGVIVDLTDKLIAMLKEERE